MQKAGLRHGQKWALESKTWGTDNRGESVWGWGLNTGDNRWVRLAGGWARATGGLSCPDCGTADCFELAFGLEFLRISLLGQLHLYHSIQTSLPWQQKLCQQSWQQSYDCTKVTSVLTGSNLHWCFWMWSYEKCCNVIWSCAFSLLLVSNSTGIKSWSVLFPSSVVESSFHGSSETFCPLPKL